MVGREAPLARGQLGLSARQRQLWMGLGREPPAKACSASLGTAAQPWGQEASSFPALSNHPFCSLLANDPIKFIRKTSVLSDRNSGML